MNLAADASRAVRHREHMPEGSIFRIAPAGADVPDQRAAYSGPDRAAVYSGWRVTSAK